MPGADAFQLFAALARTAALAEKFVVPFEKALPMVLMVVRDEDVHEKVLEVALGLSPILSA
jgi:hypothetical protein